MTDERDFYRAGPNDRPVERIIFSTPIMCIFTAAAAATNTRDINGSLSVHHASFFKR